MPLSFYVIPVLQVTFHKDSKIRVERRGARREEREERGTRRDER